jgi:transmembrane sensor
MCSENYKWSNLINKYLTEQLTSDELKELHRQMKESPSKQEQFNEFSDWKKTRHEMKGLYKYKQGVPEAWERFKARHPSDQFESVVVPIKRNYRKWSAVAAVTVTMIATVIYFLVRNGSSQLANSDFPQSRTDIRNLSKRDSQTPKPVAILTLYDGRQFHFEPKAKAGPIFINNAFIQYENGIVMVGAAKSNDFTHEILNNIITTPPGQRIELYLPDKSHITLNAASSLTFPLQFSRNERRLQLAGEALFHINNKGKIPCTILTNHALQIQVQGTFFNIRDYAEEEFKTTLIEGKINIRKGKDNYVLKPGQQARLANEKIIVSKADVEHAIGWTKNELYFTDKSLKEVLQDVGRWYNKKVIFNGSFSNETFYGKISFDSGLPKIIEMLENENNINIKDDGGKLIVTSPK